MTQIWAITCNLTELSPFLSHCEDLQIRTYVLEFSRKYDEDLLMLDRFQNFLITLEFLLLFYCSIKVEARKYNFD